MNAPAKLLERAPEEALVRTFSRADDHVLGAIRELARHAASDLGVPIALVGFLEGEFLRYPVTVGVELRSEVPAEQSFCAHALRCEDVFVVRDARADVRFARSPIVAGPPGVRFYAGAPMRVERAGAVGVLSVLGFEARDPSPDELEVLRLMARQALAQLELARSGEMLEAIFRQSGEGIVVVDENGAPRVLNEEARRQGGVDEAWSRWLPASGDGRIPVEQSLLYRAAHGERVKGERWSVPSEREGVRWLSGSAVPLRYPNGAPAGAILMTRDETLRIRMEEQLEKEASFREQLLATVGHDLRTPLSSVLMSARLLQARGARPPEQGVLDRLVRQTERMNRMVHDLLDYSRLRQGQRLAVVPSEVDLGAISRDAVAALQATHPARVLRLELRGDTCGRWDGDRLARAVTNLAGNALAHGDPHGPVTVRVEGRPDEVLLAVHNVGNPISPETMGRLFEPFWRGPSGGAGPAGSGGLGLGLHIVQEIVKAHGGTLGVRSSRSEGTTFEVALPRRLTDD
ncbi:MAG: ATP-binding protein [Anaeromyxobacteraceae bacterium]